MKKKGVVDILVISFLIRLILFGFDQFVARLPQGGIDTENFDIWAWEIHQFHPYTAVEILSNGVYFFSYYGSLIYDMFGRQPAIWAFTMILFGIGTVKNVYKGTLIISENAQLARGAAWMMCFFPNVAVLSVLVMREAPVHYFLSLAIVHMLKYMKYKSKLSLIKFFVYGLITTIFHSAMIALFAGFVMGAVFLNKKTNIFVKIAVFMLFIAGLYVVNATGIGLSKFGGSLDGALQQLGEQSDLKDSGALYPPWLQLDGNASDLLKLPIRFIAFLFAPFIPFMVKTGGHLVGVLDAWCYMASFYIIYKNRKNVIHNQMNKSILFIILAVTLAFSLGSSNFATNIRHRAKISPIILMVVFGSMSPKKEKNEHYAVVEEEENIPQLEPV